MRGCDVLVVAPTGLGKSHVYCFKVRKDNQADKTVYVFKYQL